LTHNPYNSVKKKAASWQLLLMLRVLPYEMDGTDDPFIDPGSVLLGIKLFKYHPAAIFGRDIMARQCVEADCDNIIPALFAVAESLVIWAHH
jgi:hypothetical protein